MRIVVMISLVLLFSGCLVQDVTKNADTSVVTKSNNGIKEVTNPDKSIEYFIGFSLITDGSYVINEEIGVSVFSTKTAQKLINAVYSKEDGIIYIHFKKDDFEVIKDQDIRMVISGSRYYTNMIKISDLLKEKEIPTNIYLKKIIPFYQGNIKINTQINDNVKITLVKYYNSGNIIATEYYTSKDGKIIIYDPEPILLTVYKVIGEYQENVAYILGNYFPYPNSEVVTNSIQNEINLNFISKTGQAGIYFKIFSLNAAQQLTEFDIIDYKKIESIEPSFYFVIKDEFGDITYSQQYLESFYIGGGTYYIPQTTINREFKGSYEIDYNGDVPIYFANIGYKPELLNIKYKEDMCEINNSMIINTDSYRVDYSKYLSSDNYKQYLSQYISIDSLLSKFKIDFTDTSTETEDIRTKLEDNKILYNVYYDMEIKSNSTVVNKRYPLYSNFQKIYLGEWLPIQTEFQNIKAEYTVKSIEVEIRDIDTGVFFSKAIK